MSADGLSAAKSGQICHGDETSILETTVTGLGTFLWKWKLDMVSGGNSCVDVLLDGN